MVDEKRIPITDKRTGETRLSDPIRQPTRSRSEVASETLPPVPNVSNPESELVVEPRELQPIADFSESVVGIEEKRSQEAVGDNSKPQLKAKVEIETLAQFIAHAYAQKGRKIGLKDKTERAIARNSRLSDEDKARLAELARADRLFAVPRQLLLISREVQGYQTLRSALRGYVHEAMLGHPIFSRPELQAAIQNLPEAPRPARAIAMVSEAEHKGESDDPDEPSLKPTELEELRMNAANCLAVWIADTRHLDLTELVEILSASLWEPRARKFETDHLRLRAITEIADVEGVGLACEQLRKQAREQAARADNARWEAAAASEKVTDLELELEDVRAQLAQKKRELEEVRSDAEQSLAALQTALSHELAHVHDDLEQLRTRMLRRLKTDIEQLEVGLSAVRGSEPRVHVIQDRVERVVDALRIELKNLQGE